MSSESQTPNFLPGFPGALASVAPRVDLAAWTAALTAPMRSTGIVTPRRVAAFLGQIAEETGGLMVLSENLYYSAAGLRAEWPGRFAPTPDMPAAEDYAEQPERIANYVYAGRNGNGDEASGDGWKFRGMGPMEITGRAMFDQVGKAANKTADEVADWAQTPEGGAFSACWVWQWKACNPFADVWNLSEITRRLNGGLTNLETRVRLSNVALDALNGTAPPLTLASDPAQTESEADKLMDAEQQQINQGETT